jgi:putative ABC transport system permease protein
LGGAFSGNLIVTDIRTAQECLDMPGKITRVEIIAPPEELSDIQEKLRHDLPLDVSVERPSQRGVQVENMTRSFECNLLALTFIALMVGMFLIYNTMTISVIRRRTEIGTLRAIGVSRGKVLALFLLEAFAFGVVGTALGIVGGILFAQGALDSIAKTFEHFYFKEPIETVIVNPVILLGAFALGVTLTVAAAFAPAMEAASVAPAEAARRASYEMKTSRSAGRLAIYAFTVLALAAIAAAQPPVNGLPVFGYVASLATIIGCALLMPQTLKSILPPLSCICERLFSAEGRIAARSLYGTLGRTSVATASLMIGIAMMVSLAIMIGSFRQTVMMWVDQSLKADLFIQTAARSGGSKQARLQEATVQAIRSTPGVEAVDAFVEQPILYNGERTNLAAGEFDVVGKYGHLLFRSGEDARKLCSSMTNKDCLVSEPFAIRRHVKEGDTIQLMTPKGVEAFFVRGVYYEYASDLGYVTITRSKYIDLFGDTSVSSCAVYVKSGADPDKVRAEIMRRIPSATRLAINTTGSIRKEALIVFDRTFAITYALHAIAIAVALLSVINALFALVMEFKRDFGILRYVGATQQQLRRIVLVEAGLLGAIGNAGGLVLGYLLSLLLIYVINKQSFGWTVQFSFPWVFIAQSGLLVFGTALLAGLIPARIAANTVAPSVVRDE